MTMTDKGFGSWWFLKGGGIHAAFKYRRWTSLKEIALTLPKQAWDESRKQTLEDCVAFLEWSMRGKGENIHPATKAAYEDMISVVRTADMPGAAVMETENTQQGATNGN